MFGEYKNLLLSRIHLHVIFRFIVLLVSFWKEAVFKSTAVLEIKKCPCQPILPYIELGIRTHCKIIRGVQHKVVRMSPKSWVNFIYEWLVDEENWWTGIFPIKRLVKHFSLAQLNMFTTAITANFHPPLNFWRLHIAVQWSPSRSAWRIFVFTSSLVSIEPWP